MCKTIHQKVRFKASPAEIYKVLTHSKLHSELTGHRAVIGTRAGERFSTFNKHIQGIMVDLVPGKRIVQAWRTVKFPPGVFSMASFYLRPTRSGGTELELIHRGVPKTLIPEIEAAWRKAYWDKIKKFF